MRQNISKAISITKFFSLTLDWKRIVFLLLFYPALLGSIAGLLLNNVLYGITIYVSAFFLPSLLLALLSKLIFVKPTLKQAFLASSLGAVIYSTSFFVAHLIALLTHSQWLLSAVVISGVVATFLWYFIGSVFFRKPKTALVFSALQFVIYLSALSPLLSVNASSIGWKFVASTITFGLAIGVAYYLISLPIKKSFGFSGLETLRMFFAQWLYGEADLESAFSELSEKATLPIAVLDIKNEEEVKLVVPSIHYGPFGELSSSNFPARLASSLPNSAALHGLATHDLNLANSKEVDRVVDAVYKSKAELSDRFAFAKAKHGSAKAYALVFGKDALILLSRAPEVTEDCDVSLNFILAEKLKRKFKNVAIADMHNSEGKEITYFTPYSKPGREYISAVEKLLRKPLSYTSLRVGFSTLKLSNPSLGSAGIRIFAFGWKKPIILIIVDGNSIKKECKDEIVSRMKGIDAEVLIATTDSHEKNKVSGVINEFSCSKEEASLIAQKAREALFSMKPAKAGIVVKELELSILGKDNVAEILSTINNSIALAKILIPLALVIGILISMYIISLV